MAYGEFNNKRHNFKDELIFSLTNTDILIIYSI